jgi:serine/threonine-protein kinase
MSDARETTPPEPPPTLGAPTKIGSYRLLGPLGTGGMSSVFRAMHEGSGHVVALKILPRSLAKNPTLLQRFLREAQSAEVLQHPNIVEIFDRGSEDGRYYIVLELVPGGDLHDRVRQRGPLPVREALAAMKAAARGLEYAAEKGVIHRDIKPANLLLTLDGQVKITDLGLALKAGDEDERVTRDGTTVGTVDYMSPEQARDSRATSVRSDIYSLGCTFYYLLTGQPPFPGGSLPEKLRRHAHEPPPDVREIRPDVPEPLAELIQRMMAKKPERRFLDYEHLLDAMEELRISPPSGAGAAAGTDDGRTPSIVMTALIDDEEDEDEPPAGAPDEPVLTALIDDEDDPGGFTLGPPKAEREPGSTRSHAAIPIVPASSAGPEAARPATVNLAALRGAEEEGEAIPRPRLVPPAAEPPPAPASAEPARRLPAPGAEPIALLDPVDAEVGMAGPVTLPKQAPPDRTLTVLVLRGVMAGLLLAFLGIGLFHLYNVVTTHRDARRPATEGEKPSVAEQGDALVPGGEPGAVEAQAARPPWREPGEPARPEVRPQDFPAALVSGLGLEDMRAGPKAPPPGRAVWVDRAPVQRDREHAESLGVAFDQARSGLVELVDDGPFFEGNLRVPRGELLVRAAEGRRPVVVILPPRSPAARERSAMMELAGSSLTFQGIDFVVRAADLPPRHEALFLLRGGASLTLRDCTVTVEGVAERPSPLAAVQVGLPGTPEPKPATVRLERTAIRGDALTAVRLAEGSADVAVADSLAISGDAPAFAASGGGTERSLRLLGSTVASAGPALELAGSAAGPGSTPLKVRALGNTFARVEGGTRAGSGLVAVREPAGGGPPGPPADWMGEGNQFLGWPGSPGGAASPALSGLDALREAHPGTEASSEGTADPWPAPAGTAWTTPEELASVASGGRDLWVAARPTPNLHAWTLAAFMPLPPETPGAELATVASLPGADAPGRALPGPGPTESAPGPSAPPRAGAKADAPAGPSQQLEFDADAEEGSGDLGRFLAARVKPGAARVVVRARGGGWHPFTPVRMPEGVSLEIVVEPPASGRLEDRLVWRPREEAKGTALIDVRGAELRIVGAVFERDARDALARVVRVEGGRLALKRCILTAPMDVEPGGGGLVEFRTEGTRPLDDQGGWPTATLADCVLISGGEAIVADVGRGVVALTNCAIASGTSAVTLRPQGVARDRFAADLRLERCTVAASGSFVRVAGWPGAVEGPDRPWLVASRGCAFLDRFDRGRAAAAAVLLRADPSSLARGVLEWQSESDAYDVEHFVVGGDEVPGLRSFGDLRTRWVEFWGPSHVRGALDADDALDLAAGKLGPGPVTPGDLVVLPHPKAPSLGADLARLGIRPPAQGGKPRRPAR